MAVAAVVAEEWLLRRLSHTWRTLPTGAAAEALSLPAPLSLCFSLLLLLLLLLKLQNPMTGIIEAWCWLCEGEPLATNLAVTNFCYCALAFTLAGSQIGHVRELGVLASVSV